MQTAIIETESGAKITAEYSTHSGADKITLSQDGHHAGQGVLCTGRKEDGRTVWVRIEDCDVRLGAPDDSETNDAYEALEAAIREDMQAEADDAYEQDAAEARREQLERVGKAIAKLDAQQNQCDSDTDGACDDCDTARQWAVMAIKTALREGFTRAEVLDSVSGDKRDWVESVIDGIEARS